MIDDKNNDDIGRGITAVRLGIGQAIEDAEATMFTMREAYSARTTDERVSGDGTFIGESRERASALVAVLNAALSLCPNMPPEA